MAERNCSRAPLDAAAAGHRPRLCMVVHAYYPLAEPRVQREAFAARDAGFAVTVLALRGSDEPPRESIDGIAVRRLPLGHVRGGGLSRIMVEYLAFCVLAASWLAQRTVRKAFDIVHFHNPPDFLVLCGLIPRLRGARLVLDIHDLSPHMLSVRLSGRLGRIASVALTLIERLACSLVDQVLTVHAPYRDELIRHGVAGEKVQVVMNSVDETLLAQARRATRFGARSAAFTVVYHGTLTWWYGGDLILDAVAGLRLAGFDIDAVILGDGDAVPSLRTRAEEEGLRGHVELSGRYLPIAEALATASEADCGVIPNRPCEINRFALSSKLFEYIALGIPVVVARLETLAMHFSSDEVTFFEPGSVAALETAIRWVYEHPAEARAKSRRAQARAQAYSWASGRKTLTDVYRSLQLPSDGVWSRQGSGELT
jgi:glycosyltransferase involved in cell wall biosynthesis